MPEEFSRPRGGLRPTLVHDGGHIIANVQAFLRDRVFLGARTVPFYPPHDETLDINEPRDLMEAEFRLASARASAEGGR